MSAFSQLGNALTGRGPYHNGIDHEFSPVLKYLDEFDRHFSQHHRFMNCFIPRFDLEEDSQSYYLYGEVAGARVEDITIEAHGDKTLVIHGRTNRPYALNQSISQRQNTHSNDSEPFVKAPVQDNGHKGVSPSEDSNTYIKVDVSDAGKPIPGHHAPPAPNGTHPSVDLQDPNPPAPRLANVINVDVSDAGKPTPKHHHPNRLVEHDSSDEHVNKVPEHRALLSERLVGDFHRTFTFPCPFSEEGVKANVENGLLSLVVPKIGEKARGKRIHIGNGKVNEHPIQNMAPGGGSFYTAVANSLR